MFNGAFSIPCSDVGYPERPQVRSGDSPRCCQSSGEKLTPSAWWVRKHSLEKVTFEVGLEGGQEDKEGCQSNRRPDRRMSQWSRKSEEI